MSNCKANTASEFCTTLYYIYLNCIKIAWACNYAIVSHNSVHTEQKAEFLETNKVIFMHTRR